MARLGSGLLEMKAHTRLPDAGGIIAQQCAPYHVRFPAASVGEPRSVMTGGRVLTAPDESVAATYPAAALASCPRCRYGSNGVVIVKARSTGSTVALQTPRLGSLTEGISGWASGVGRLLWLTLHFGAVTGTHYCCYL